VTITIFVTSLNIIYKKILNIDKITLLYNTVILSPIYKNNLNIMNPVISAVLIIIFSISIITLVLNFGLPLINQQKLDIDFQNGKNIVNKLIIDISTLLSKPINSSIEKEIELSNGLIKFSNNTISYILSLETYNRTLDNIIFSNISIYKGKTKLKLTKISRNFIEVKILN